MTTHTIYVYEVDAEEAAHISGGNLMVPSEVAMAVNLSLKPIKYYTLAIGEDGGDMPELMWM